MKIKPYLFTLLLLVTSVANGGIYTQGWGTKLLGRHIGATLNLDLKKSFVSGYFDLKGRNREPIKLPDHKMGFAQEISFYGKLAYKSLIPSYFLVELDTYPLTASTVWLKKNQRDFYDSSEVEISETKFNPIQLIGSRYEKPYSLSMFLGEILPIVTNSGQQSGATIMGHVVTLGNKSILKLDEKKDHWLHYAYKIKGGENKGGIKKKWNFQFGYVNHTNPHFIDAYTFVLIRDWANKNDPSFWANFKVEWTTHFHREELNRDKNLEEFVSYQELILGKNFPFHSFIINLDFGIRWQLYRENFGTLSETTLIASPNITW